MTAIAPCAPQAWRLDPERHCRKDCRVGSSGRAPRLPRKAGLLRRLFRRFHPSSGNRERSHIRRANSARDRHPCCCNDRRAAAAKNSFTASPPAGKIQQLLEITKILKRVQIYSTVTLFARLRG